MTNCICYQACTALLQNFCLCEPLLRDNRSLQINTLPHSSTVKDATQPFIVPVKPSALWAYLAAVTPQR